MIRDVGAALQKAPIDVALVGIGENGHLAFNDPPADFETEEPYIVVTLDEACRKQQLGEGWFANLSEIPRQAISMSIRQILQAREIICAVSDARKARAVAACVEGEISPLAPASILRTHPNATVYLDKERRCTSHPRPRHRNQVLMRAAAGGSTLEAGEATRARAPAATRGGFHYNSGMPDSLSLPDASSVPG